MIRSRTVSGTPLLVIEDLDLFLNTCHGKAQMLHHVSFSLDHGTCMCLVGESGCGKTLTALSILGLVSAVHGTIENGRILFQGQDLLQATEKKLRTIRGDSISMIFQNPASALNPYLRISEQLIEGLIHHKRVTEKEALRKGIDLMEKVGIPDARNRIHDFPHRFSGGMLQRIMIATALMTSPALIIADEPTSALDVTIQGQTLELLDDLRKNADTAIMLITHDLG
ncbi:MAG: ABC transporter ATP-binding protein, partial [Planctomycetota bacterium]